jgi:hypothetical protein
MSFSKNQSAKSTKSSEPLASNLGKSEKSDARAANLPTDASEAVESEASSESIKQHPHPIPPAGEPMQYRAIGLVKGQYIPSTEQFTQGTLVSSDNTLISSVLLGRVMSLVKKHVDLSQHHLWVVYPRVGKEDGKLHLQIVGIWEPETLKTEDGEAQTAENNGAELTDGYFSIRGDVIFHSLEERNMIVKIKQAARKQGEKPKFFKLKLQGALAEKAIGHFWDLNVQRQGENLVVQSGTDIGETPKGKPIRKKFPPRRDPRSEGSRPIIQKPITSRSVKDNQSNSENHPPNLFRKPIPKPSKRQPSSD